MKTRLPWRLGSLLAFFVFAGCAVPPGATDQVSGTPLSTRGARATVARSTRVPLGHDSALASMSTAGSSAGNGNTLADAEPIGDAGPNVSDFTQTGRASWYGRKFHGRRTASGERYDMNALTAAHKTLPLAAYVRVTNSANSKSVVVRINDRGPYARGRVIDLSYAAARMLGLQHSGVARVKIEGLSQQEAKVARAEMLASNTAK
jgi:rare lipoprotein A